MTPSHSNISLVVVTAIVAAVGLVDAVVSGEDDFIVVFGAMLLLLVALLLRTQTARVRITLRSDLVAWLRRRSASSGEPMEAIVDRAVAAYRAQFVSDRDIAMPRRLTSEGDEPVVR